MYLGIIEHSEIHRIKLTKFSNVVTDVKCCVPLTIMSRLTSGSRNGHDTLSCQKAPHPSEDTPYPVTMSQLARPVILSSRTTSPHLRPVATTATSTSTSSKRVTFPVRSATSTATSPKPTGDISSVFPSLSSTSPPPLPPRFADLKKRLIHCHEPSIQASWTRLLAALQQQRQEIKVLGSTIVPEINFWELSDVGKRTKFRDALHKRGVAVIRGVVSEKEALEWKELVQRYIRTNPSTRGTILPVFMLVRSCCHTSFLHCLYLRFLA